MVKDLPITVVCLAPVGAHRSDCPLLLGVPSSATTALATPAAPGVRVCLLADGRGRARAEHPITRFLSQEMNALKIPQNQGISLSYHITYKININSLTY